MPFLDHIFQKRILFISDKLRYMYIYQMFSSIIIDKTITTKHYQYNKI